MDEPTSGLDAQAAQQIRELIPRLVGGGMTVVVITHSREMKRACSSVALLKAGRVVEEGSFEALSRRRDGELRRLLSSVTDLGM